MKKNKIVNFEGSKVRHILQKLMFKLHDHMEYDMNFFLKA